MVRYLRGVSIINVSGFDRSWWWENNLSTIRSISTPQEISIRRASGHPSGNPVGSIRQRQANPERALGQHQAALDERQAIPRGASGERQAIPRGASGERQAPPSVTSSASLVTGVSPIFDLLRSSSVLTKCTHELRDV